MKATGTLPSLSSASVLFVLALILFAPAAYSRDHTDCANSAGMKESITTASQEDFAKAFQLCKPLAEQGLAEAQFNLGFMYFSQILYVTSYYESSFTFITISFLVDFVIISKMIQVS